jgi:hypothetical protein
MSGRANKKHYREQAKREKREAKERKRDLRRARATLHVTQNAAACEWHPNPPPRMNAFQGAPAQYKPSTEPEEYAALSGKRPREPDHLGTPAANP